MSKKVIIPDTLVTKPIGLERELCAFISTPNFEFSEFVKTDSGLSNIPHTFHEVRNIFRLACFLQYVRKELGQPIIINSAYRTPEVNKAVGGVSTSKHMQGLAADITCVDNDALSEILKEYYDLGYLDEYIIYYKLGSEQIRFIHVAIHDYADKVL